MPDFISAGVFVFVIISAVISCCCSCEEGESGPEETHVCKRNIYERTTLAVVEGSDTQRYAAEYAWYLYTKCWLYARERRSSEMKPSVRDWLLGPRNPQVTEACKAKTRIDRKIKVITPKDGDVLAGLSGRYTHSVKSKTLMRRLEKVIRHEVLINYTNTSLS
jgi:hypothetical protein